MKVVSVKNLSFSYDGEHPTLRDVSFDVETGSYVAVIGHNGSGKSTLAKILMGLLGDWKGEVTLFDLPLTDKNLVELRKKIGIVFQNPDNQFVGSTVSDDIAFGLENRQIPHEDMQGIIEKYAKETGMYEFLERESGSLSGGQKQRVAIAGVLAMNPELVIFDEATAMLDPKGKNEIAAIVEKMRKDNPNLTIISITHDVEEAARADQVIVMNDGQTVLSGTPNEVFAHEDKLKEIRLDIPFFPSLVHALERNGIKVPESVDSLEKLEDFLCR